MKSIIHERINEINIADILIMALVKRNFFVNDTIVKNAIKGIKTTKYPDKII
jgi:hypothetical protein